MSADREAETPEVETLPGDRTEGSTELDMRAVFEILFNDPAVKNFTFTTLGALGMIFLILFQEGSDVGAILIVIFGLCGLFLRWTASPLIVLLILTYFLILPTGVPGEGFESLTEIDQGHFRVADIMLVLSALVYLTCQYRILGLVQQAIAFDAHARRKDEPPTRRPAALIRPVEFGIMLVICLTMVFAGQLIWLIITSVEIAPGERFPFRWAEPGRAEREHLPISRFDVVPPGNINTGPTRFVVIVGLLFFGMLVARLVFGYWRLRTIGAAEGGMLLLDGSWSETSRDRQRIEKWRIWGRKRLEQPRQTETEKKS